ncbi:MAG: acetyl-CoA carboxylase biotin carboxyl carrier protein [Elusimicrobia bacterium]|nr:acetyl-CoA carboxylase biotin carboxyl carrier protein [Elusimicrobiota bacterium]
MNIEKIKSLLDAIKDTDIEEIWLEKDGHKSGFKRKDVSENPFIEPKKISPKKQESEHKESVHSASPPPEQYIKSPMVGTFFRSSSPGGEPFIDEGDFVTVGQKLCIIEAMKVMKEITSPYEGKIIKILIQDNHPVEYGQPIFEVNTDRKGKETQ